MEVIPAVDIKGGRCVRLYQGDYSRETVFSDNAVVAAARWAAQGASRLHLVDLDGAASGQLRNLAVVEKIVRGVNIPVQLGGGIRDEAVVARLLQAGVSRVVLGTAAVENPELSLSGFLAAVSQLRPYYEVQAVYFNRRPVRSRSVVRALLAAYGPAARERRPDFVLFLTTDPAKLDAVSYTHLTLPTKA